MVAVASKEGGAAGSWRAQQIRRAAKRRRRPNVIGPKRTVEVVLSEAEYAAVKEAADEIPATVPWYLVESVLPSAGTDEKPVAVPRKSEGAQGPWLPWAKRKAVAATLMSAARSLHEVRLSALAHIGANINQLARVANTHGVIEVDELEEALADLRELMADLSERAETMEQLARQAVRR